MKFPPNFNNPFKKENLPESLQNFRELRESRKAVKRNSRDNIPLNFRERSNARTSLIASIVVLAFLVLFFNQLDYRLIRKPAIDAQKKTAAMKEQQKTEAAATETTTASVIAVGDNLYHQSLIDAGASEDGNWNYDKIYTHILDAIKDADVKMIDQETVFTTDHDSVSSYPSFATPTEVGDAIIKAGFNVVESANNHIDDFGEGFLNDTLNFWKTKYPDVTLLGIHDSQEDSDTVKIREVNGIKIAFLDYTYGTNVGGIEGKDYMIDMIRKEKITTMIQKAKKQADCIIFVAHWGTEDETMPNEYEKQWAAYLMEQGVNVIIGGHPHVLQPYGRLTDDKGNETVVFYSLGNFVSTQQKLEELLGGMAKFTIQKTVQNGKTSIQILTPTVEPLVMHYNSEAGEFGPYMLSDYTEELASQHGVQKYIGNVFTLDNLKKKFNEIMSMNVTPSTGTDLLDVTINTDLNMVDASGNVVEDTNSITAEQYYADKGIDVNSEDFNAADNGSGNSDDSSYDSSDDSSYDDSSYDDSSYDDSYDDSSYDDSSYDASYDDSEE
ncbi:CapA family protein [Blautia sp. CLA-JM-H16]|uniref:CapA family protein n=1 Tax=Blautia aquisgranensis TaxID=3133153 RepID=A0ABV1BHF1_9FIRM